MYIISACLVGINCKYNGGNNLYKELVKLVKEGKAIPVCPEQLGGLSTPRHASEIVIDKKGEKRVINRKGEDVTDKFLKGGYETLKIAETVRAEGAILKARSPSCGYGHVYDGTFSGRLKEGNGITTDILINNGIKVYTEEEYIKLNKKKDKEE